MRIFILTLITISVITLALCTYGLNVSKLKIREISNVEDWVAWPQDMSVVVKCYIIDNPPADYSEWRKIAEKHIDDNWANIVSSGGQAQTMYKCFFYRVSKRLPWSWKENNGYLSEDHIEDHTDDMIVAVRWTSQDIVREYSIMKKSDVDDNYGSLLKEVHLRGINW